jgi:lipopolysaccharide transport system ATP-binding protein
VRLAFAVAAYLEPDILIVDEVLAVGDAEFQKKCLGKMKDVSEHDGRTVLFVSHNMTAIQSICNTAVLLDNGRITGHGQTKNIVDLYLKKIIKNHLQSEWNSIHEAPGNEMVRIKSIKAIPLLNGDDERITLETPLTIDFEFWNLLPQLVFNLSMHVFNSFDQLIFASRSHDYTIDNNLVKLSCQIPAHLLNDGGYYVTMMIVNNNKAVYVLEEAISFEIVEGERKIAWLAKWPGYVRPKLEWTITNSVNQVIQQ